MDFYLLCVLISSIVAILAVAAGVRLFELDSKYAEFVKKVAVPAAIITSFLTIFILFLPDVSENLGLITVTLILIVSLMGFITLGHDLSIMRQIALEPVKHKHKRKPTPHSIWGVRAIDIVGGILDGLAIGISFHYNVGSGIFTVCSLAMFLIMQKVACVINYLSQGINARKTMLTVVLSLLVIPPAAILGYLFCGGATSGIASAGAVVIVMGYLLYYSLWHLYFIVKNSQKS